MAAGANSERWRRNWEVVAPPAAVHVALGRGRAALRAAAIEVRALPAGTPVAVAAAAPRAAARCRRFAERAGIRVEREYLAVPSAAAPAYLIEDAAAAFHVFVWTIPPAPSPGVIALIQEAALRSVRLLRPRRLVRALAAGSLVVGARA